MHQTISIPVTSPHSSETSLTMFSDIDTSFPDELFLRGRKLDPGML